MLELERAEGERVRSEHGKLLESERERERRRLRRLARSAGSAGTTVASSWSPAIRATWTTCVTVGAWGWGGVSCDCHVTGV